MDNVRFHHSKIVKDCIINSGNEILYNIAYCKDLLLFKKNNKLCTDTNPIENCFSVSKNYVRKIGPVTENELVSSIVKSLKLLTPTKLVNMFNNSFTNL